jgi:flagellar hook-associated protein 2
MTISSPGIGSNLDVNSIVSQLMSIEQQPLALLDKKTSAVQAKINAMGTVSNSLGSFQTALSSLTSASAFLAAKATAADTAVLSATAGATAVSGTYKVNVSQLAKAQSLSSAGRASISTAIGTGISTTVTFQLGTTTGGSFGVAGGALGASVGSSGIAGGALSINGTSIATDSSTRSAKALADAINAKSGTTGVSATAQTTTGSTLFTTFGPIDTSAGGSYTLSVGGVQVATQAGGATPIDKAGLDTALAGASSQLAAAGITYAGSAVGGDLQFKNSDGADISITEVITGTVKGGIGKDNLTANSGSSLTSTGTVSLASSDGSPITVGGSNPAAAGFTAGTGGQYLGASFTQDANQTSASVVIDSKNNTLQGIRDAINKASLGVTATIVSDGSANPYRLVLTSNKTGEHSTMKITAAGTGGGGADPAVAALLGYDPGGVQSLQQTSAGQSTKLSVNGIAVTSESNTVSEAIQGVTLNVSTLGSTSVNVATDTSTVKTNVNNFVKAFNDLNASIRGVSSYNAATKTAGPLFGDSTLRNLQSSLRSQLNQGVTGLSGQLSSLSQAGITFQKDGTLAVDSSKLDKAIKDNLSDLSALFAVVGSATDGQVSFEGSTSATKPGEYAVRVTSLATQGSLTSSAAPGATTTITPGTKWKISLDQQSDNILSSHTATVDIPGGDYTPAQLAAVIQSAINGASNFSANSLSASATIDGSGRLVVSSSKWGKQSNIEIDASAGFDPATLFASPGPAAGTDVAGTIGGEPATGSGQYLTAGTGSPAEGLKIKVSGGSVPADRGTVSFSQGYAYQLNNLANDYVGSKGQISTRKDGLNQSIKDIDKERTRINTQLAMTEKRYRAQFTALDAAISSMNTTANFLAQQLARLG